MGTPPAGKQTLRDVALGVGVDDEQLLAAFLADAGKEPDGVGFAHATLEVDDGDGLGAVLRETLARSR